MRINLKRAVATLAKQDLKFLQPLYEAIANSLESNSTEILVDIDTEELISDELTPRITGFTVSDNGEGFTQKNIDSFLELWSDAKMHLGCKGSGRFTWLNVFDNIDIRSEVSNESKLVEIPFSLEFKDDDIRPVETQFSETRTIITFSNITKKYFDQDLKLDRRDYADIDTIKQNIEQNLLIKLFLLKNSGVKFTIKIKIGEQERHIDELSIPDLKSTEFSIYSEITKMDYSFMLYYHFLNNAKNSKKIYYCAHNRTVKEEDDDALNFSCALPDKVSFNMLLCSSYLDDMVNDSRDDFPGMSNKRQANLGCPLLYKDIKPELLRQMHQILMDRFPELENLNYEQERRAIDASPYLAKYIKDVDDIVKTEKSLTTKALDAFNKDKVKIRTKFEKLLKDKSIGVDTLNAAVQELSEVAVAELGEYVLYRDNIIKALADATLDVDTNEDFIHDIFMPRGSIVSPSSVTDYTMTNLWLLDDKFMTFANAFSNVTVKRIVDEIFKNSTPPTDKVGMNSKRPDMAVFYNASVSRDALVIEFKGAHAKLIEKETALGEIRRNCLLLKEKIPEINTIWSYIITSIDDEFAFSLRANGYTKLFTNADEGKIFYSYSAEVGHVFAVDISTIAKDAFARNKTFLDILKHQ